MRRTLQIDAASAIPIWNQIEDGLRRLVASGTLAANAAVPSVRDLARDLQVNPATVSKAYQRLTDGGVLSTETDLVFSGGRDGYFVALDATNGTLLWKANLGGGIAAGPMAYGIGGREYIAVSAGNSLFSFALRQ